MVLNDIDALLFDLGGVVTQIDFGRATNRWAWHAGANPAAIGARFTHDASFKLHETGAQFLDGWNNIFVGEMPGMSVVLQQMARKMRIYAFSNTNRPHVLHWSKRYEAICSHFTHMFLSSTIGLRKPDGPAFDYVVDKIGVAAERILFFDDNLENIEGAKARRLRAVHVATPGTVAETLAPLLAL